MWWFDRTIPLQTRSLQCIVLVISGQVDGEFLLCVMIWWDHSAPYSALCLWFQGKLMGSFCYVWWFDWTISHPTMCCACDFRRNCWRPCAPRSRSWQRRSSTGTPTAPATCTNTHWNSRGSTLPPCLVSSLMWLSAMPSKHDQHPETILVWLSLGGVWTVVKHLGKLQLLFFLFFSRHGVSK